MILDILVYSSTQCFLKLQDNLPFVSREEAKIDFQDGDHSGHLGFPIGTILATFDLQVTLRRPTKFHVSWPFVSGEANNGFSRRSP